MSDTILALAPMFENVIRHALHGNSKVIDKHAKKRLKEFLEQKKGRKIRLRRKDKRRPRIKENKI